MEAFGTDILLSVFQQGQLIERYKGEVIIASDEKPAGVYFIESGFIKVYSISRAGSQKLHIIYKAGEIFPLIWAVNSTLRNVFYEAVTDVRLWKVDRKIFLDRLQDDPRFAYEVMKKLAAAFQIYADRLDNLEYSSAYQRTVYRLVSLSRRFGRKTDEGVLIQAPLTHQLIADSINLTRETVSRELELLERNKLIAYRGHQFIIPDQSKLLEELLKFA